MRTDRESANREIECLLEHVEHDVGDVGMQKDEYLRPDPADEVGVG